MQGCENARAIRPHAGTKPFGTKPFGPDRCDVFLCKTGGGGGVVIFMRRDERDGGVMGGGLGDEREEGMRDLQSLHVNIM